MQRLAKLKKKGKIMGREIKRVKLDFDWPIGKRWTGYLILTCTDICEDCHKFAKIVGLPYKEGLTCPQFPDFEPPKGEGYQLWEDTSEGSPMSPVFETPEALADWLEFNKVSSCGDMTCSYDQWLDFIKGPGWAPSMVLDSTGVHSGVCAISAKPKT